MIERWASRVGLTEGQAYTYLIGLVLAVVAAAGTVPPALHDGKATVAAAEPAQTAAPSPIASPSADAEEHVATAVPTGRAGRQGRSSGAQPSVAVDVAPAPATTSVISRAPELRDPEAVVVTPETIFVATNPPDGSSPGTVVALRRDGKVIARLELGDVPAGSRLTGMAADGDRLLIVGRDPAALYELDLATGRVAELARLPDVPVCLSVLRQDACELGPVDGAPAPRGIAVDRGGAIYVADESQGAIWRLQHGESQPTMWAVGDDLRSLTARGGPVGLAVAPDGSLVVAVSTSGVGADGMLLRQTVEPDGAAGPRRRLATIPAGAGPSAVSSDSEGRVYLTLAARGQLLVFTADGDEDGAVGVPEAPLGRPTSVAVHGDAAFVAAPGAEGDGTAAIVRVPLALTRRAG